MPHSTDTQTTNAYLNRYAEPLNYNLPTDKQYQHVLVIPAFKEEENFLESVLPDKVNSLLVIVVLNTPDSVLPTDKETTLKFLKRYSLKPLSENLSWCTLNETKNLDLLVIDRASSHPLPKKQGVGLARKIGNDLALSLIHSGVITKPWIYNTDADVRLPESYFSMQLRGAACLFPFIHVAQESKIQKKVDLYELHLRYYVHQLRYAQSPYAFHSLGSAISVSAPAYAKVRGFPRRAAGEDFYLLNKLAKTGVINSLQKPVITVAGRHSDRVPFGTGPAITKITPEKDTYLSYNPKIFHLLANFQQALLQAPSFSSEVLKAAPTEILENIGFEAALPKLNSATNNPDRWRRSLTEWFDGFRTLKFVHEARKNLPDVPLVESVRQILQSKESPKHLLNRLRNQERTQNLTN